MLDFICPTCGNRVQGDESLAGNHVQCSFCNRTMTVPTTAVPNVTPHILRRWMPAIFGVVIVGTLTALIIPAVLNVREAAARTQSTNNLKNIGMAFHSFHDTHKRLPFNGTVPAKKGDITSGSWGFQIRDYIDAGLEPPMLAGDLMFMCPARGRPIACTAGGWSDYFINPWLNDPNGAVDAADIKRTLVSITDGTANTIMLGHGSIDPDLYQSNVAFAQSTEILRGGSPGTARRSTTNQRDKSGNGALTWGGPFPQGSLMCMCDATVRVFPYEMTGGEIDAGHSPLSPNVRVIRGTWFAMYLTPNGHEVCALQPD